MENLRECPICFEIPEKEIYQCWEGHIICSVCIQKLTQCPQCRTYYGARRIRCRVLEVLLDGQMFECKLKVKGCRHLCRRSDISKHTNSCEFNPDLIRLCSLVGWRNCKFGIACGDNSKECRSSIINHFMMAHHRLVKYETHEKIQGHHIKWAIKESLTGQQTITTLLHSLEDTIPLFLLVLKFSSANDFITLNCIQLWSADASKKYKVDCSVIKGATSPQTANSNKDVVKCGIDKFDHPLLISWTLNVYSPQVRYLSPPYINVVRLEFSP